MDKKCDVYYKVRKTIIEMLHDRNYTVTDEEKNLNYSDFSEKFYENQINFEGTYKDNDDKLILIYFFLENKTFGKKDLVGLKTLVNEKYVDKDLNIIIVLQDKPTSQINKEILIEDYKNIEIFLVKNLLVNVTKHIFVPKHEILSQEEGKEILEKFKCTRLQLPKILSSDAIAKYYGMKPGQICKITRNSNITGESIYYRLVK